MKLSQAKQTKIYEAIHEEVMKVRIAIRMNSNIKPNEIDDLLYAVPNKAIDEILCS